MVGVGAAAAAGFALRGRRSAPVAVNRLRPPGAVPEGDFLAACVRCGRCAEVCPYRCIRLLDARDGVDAGTPVVEIRDVPCYLCMECVDVCPSGALRPIEDRDVRMGLAVVDEKTCVSWTGELLCRTCYNVCPFPDEAIDLPLLRPEVIDEGCTGCGICVHACPVEGQSGKKAINVEPPEAAS
ncbi:MAG: 4Fe-4S dicluster domain-containing protein [Planctomycetota bacterium]